MSTQLGVTLDRAQAYTMRELNQRTAEVIREINDSGKQAVITRHGRHVAIIVPVANELVEGAVLRAVLETTLGRDRGASEDDDVRLYSTDEAAAELGIVMP